MATVKDKESKTTPAATICGLVMPISTLDGCPEQHWIDVREILSDAIRDAMLEPSLVSDADDVGIIQKRIIQNLYSNPIVVCDVSGKNPNVMFELGLRLAFDKPTIIVKDDKTSYSFDTSPIEHLTYPRDLRFNLITKFKKDLVGKLTGTLQKAGVDPSYTTVLKNFGKFTIAKLDTTEVSKEEFILEELGELRRQMSRLGSRLSPREMRMVPDELHRLGHSLDPDECEKYLTEAVLRLASLMESDPSRNDVFESAIQVIRRCKDMDLLPPCFEEDKASCRHKLEEVIQNVVVNKRRRRRPASTQYFSADARPKRK